MPIIPISKCKCCEKNSYSSLMTKRDYNGGNYYFVCNDCKNIKKTAHVCNTYDFSSVDNNGYGLIIEFNISEKCEFLYYDVIRDLYKWNIECDDMSRISYISKLYTSLSSISKIFSSIDEILNVNYWNKEDDYRTPCMLYIKKENILANNIFNENYMKIFEPLYKILIEETDRTKILFGAAPNENLLSEEDLRRFFVDVDNNIITFKFCKYLNGSQYIEVIKRFRNIYKCILKWVFSENQNDDQVKHRIEIGIGKLRKLCKSFYR